VEGDDEKENDEDGEDEEAQPAALERTVDPRPKPNHDRRW
jgi:hypothetical protein